MGAEMSASFCLFQCHQRPVNAEILSLVALQRLASKMPADIDRALVTDVTGELEKRKMLSRCANETCGKPFLRLREGKLFLVETDRVMQPGKSLPPPFVRARRRQRLVEHYWLCDQCAEQWTLAYDREGGIVLMPLRRPTASTASADSAAHSGAA